MGESERRLPEGARREGGKGAKGEGGGKGVQGQEEEDGKEAENWSKRRSKPDGHRGHRKDRPGEEDFDENQLRRSQKSLLPGRDKIWTR